MYQEYQLQGVSPLPSCSIVVFFFSSLARFRYLFFFLRSFNFTRWSARTAKSTIWQVLDFLYIYFCTTWTLTKRLEKKLDDNYTGMLRAILNESWWQHPTRHQLYSHLPPITKTIQVRRNRHAGHCWRSRDELISDVLLWTPVYGRAKTGRPARTYIQQLCEDTGCGPEDLPEAMNDREKRRERVRDIHAGGTKWWWSSLGLDIWSRLSESFVSQNPREFCVSRTISGLCIIIIIIINLTNFSSTRFAYTQKYGNFIIKKA